ncbi:hypothetical protein BpHYR1_030045 [Brachionus plicatilis]|uniref:Uncharacterized protein n=1 Tax=Brachionus plicatilis TaxID=10195 RepID=A0A3M7P7Y5_BRAPC|nr:hypothetical protein BpHYR1_030045 [Brachionus plicatilis]
MKLYFIVIMISIIVIESNGQFFSSNDGIYLPRNGKRSFKGLENLEKYDDIQKLKQLLSKTLNSRTENTNSKESNDLRDSNKLDNVLYRFLLKEWIKNQLN